MRSVHPPVIPPDNRILFFSRDRDAFSFLSNFFPAAIQLDGEAWPTVEHYYQCQKSFDPAYRQAIREAISPGKAKRLAAPPTAHGQAGQQSWFRRNHTEPRPDWHEAKLEIMRCAVHAKFAQHPDLGQLLAATQSAELVEDSPHEPYWGTGPDGQGLNWLGRVLMEVRGALRAQQGQGG